MMVSFHFPAVAQERYEEAIAIAAEEAGVPISIAPNAHQGALAKTACACLPQGLTVQGTPSIHFDRKMVSLTCGGHTIQEELIAAHQRFSEETGWHLEVKGATISPPVPSDASNEARVGDSAQVAPAALPNLPAVSSPVPETGTPAKTASGEPMNQHDAIQLAQQMTSKLPGYTKAGGDVAANILLLRFSFPLVAQTRYADIFAELEARTGWRVQLHPTTNQQALTEMARRLLPPGLACEGTPSLYLDQQMVLVNYTGHAEAEALQEAQHRFFAETGWQLDLIASGEKKGTSGQLPQADALSLTHETFKEAPDFYRVGADAKKSVLWIHFRLPDKAKERYAQQLADLARKTGWQVYCYPYAQQKALIEVARRLLPEAVQVNGKASLYQENRTLTLTGSGSLTDQEKEDIQQQFSEETGWTLDLRIALEEISLMPESQ